MNERIRKLIRKLDNEIGRYYWTDKEKEKFAELIVRECLASIPSDGHRGDFGRAVEFCQQQIKQHFEVEGRIWNAKK